MIPDVPLIPPIPDIRPIAADEARVIREAIESAAVISVSPSLLASIDNLTVKERCACGCASIDFEQSSVAFERATIIVDGTGRAATGEMVGVIIWGLPEEITGIEIYDFGNDNANFKLPETGSIRSWENSLTS